MTSGVWERTEKQKSRLRNLRVGVKFSKEHRKKISDAHFKEYDDICYKQKHQRIRKKYGDPRYCENCKRTDKKRYEWSNKDHKYSDDIKDWKRLCVSCHREYDKKLRKKL